MGDMADDQLDSDMDLTFDFDWRSTTPKFGVKDKGPGKCPRCGAKTQLRPSKNGMFYGCSKYPDCKGSRDFE